MAVSSKGISHVYVHRSEIAVSAEIYLMYNEKKSSKLASGKIYRNNMNAFESKSLQQIVGKLKPSIN